MKIIRGKGVFGAVAVGKISFFNRSDAEVVREKISSPETEIARFESAKSAAKSQLDTLYEKALKEVGEANAQIFDIHKMMLDDMDYNESVKNIIETQLVNAEYAVALTADNFSYSFDVALFFACHDTRGRYQEDDGKVFIFNKSKYEQMLKERGKLSSQLRNKN